MSTFVMTADAKNEPAAVKGTAVYKCRKCDYGLAADDSRITGMEHVSVTLDPTGDYPFFTVPKDDLSPA